MIKMLFPEQYLDSVYELDLKKLQNESIEAVIFDIDNTLVPYFVPVADTKIKRFLSKIRRKGFKIGILSNNKEQRVSLFCKDLDIDYIHKAGKPGIKGLGKLVHKLGVNHKNTVLIGDQIFTDVWCGNRMGVHTVLVKPVSERDEFGTKLKRGLESLIINLYLKERGIQ